MQYKTTELTDFASAFIREWYRRIDSKTPFPRLEEMTVGEEIIVDFPNNPLNFDGFRRWYEGQCRDFTGEHCIHSVRATQGENELVIFSEITWRARSNAGEQITLYPNVTLKLRPESRKIFYYGCVDRDISDREGKEQNNEKE